MQLPDETIEFNYQGLLAPNSNNVPWSPLLELQTAHYLRQEQIEALKPQMMLVKQQVGAERELKDPPEKILPLDSAFIDMPGKLIERYRRKGENSDVGRILAAAAKIREAADRVVVLGIGGSFLGAKALFDALCNTC
jgi:glucose-6-phosphate isomerase